MSWQPGGVLLSRARLRFRAAEVSLDLLEAAVLGFRYAFLEVHQGDDGEEREEEEGAVPVDSAEQGEEKRW